jgi:hypothetical protein
MKLYSTLLAIAFSLVFITSCDKDITYSEQLSTLSPASLDEDAGTWDMIVLNTPNQVALAAAPDITTDAYKGELAAIKDAQSKLNDDQKKIIEYWSGGSTLRWNQILRGLVARYNLPPAPRADGTYPAPDAENPFADPNFPFANPPYAARAYSYVAVAQYEAMKATWFYKYQLNRQAPYKQDSGIKALMAETNLPSYPSEEAVMSGVTAEMLKLLFPAAVEEITLRAADQRNAALWAGKATATEIANSLAFGKLIADEVKKRAAGDGMRDAIGKKPQWDALAANTEAKGEKAWSSLETPKRPPMLPFFGNVKAWNMTPAQITAGRPVPPPTTSSAEMQKEVDEVKWFSQNLTRERLSIVHKWADGAGTYTPPGHWNDIAAEYIRDANYSEVRASRAFALLNMALHDAAVCCWETKYYYFNPRPTQMNPDIKTGTGIPNFPAFTSGHSTFSGSAATVLSYLFPSQADYFMQEASEASMSRMYGGIHYRSDVEVGFEQGKNVGKFTVTYAQTDGAD